MSRLQSACAGVQIIPALERIFSLVGADLRAWFAAMPRPQKLLPQKRPQGVNAGREAPPGQHLGPSRPPTVVGTIDRYYLSRHCAVGWQLPFFSAMNYTKPFDALQNSVGLACWVVHQQAMKLCRYMCSQCCYRSHVMELAALVFLNLQQAPYVCC